MPVKKKKATKKKAAKKKVAKKKKAAKRKQLLDRIKEKPFGKFPKGFSFM